MDDSELPAIREFKKLIAIRESAEKQRASRHAALFLPRFTRKDDLAATPYFWICDFKAERCSSTKPSVPSCAAGEND